MCVRVGKLTRSKKALPSSSLRTWNRYLESMRSRRRYSDAVTRTRGSTFTLEDLGDVWDGDAATAEHDIKQARASVHQVRQFQAQLRARITEGPPPVDAHASVKHVHILTQWGQELAHEIAQLTHLRTELMLLGTRVAGLGFRLTLNMTTRSQDASFRIGKQLERLRSIQEAWKAIAQDAFL